MAFDEKKVRMVQLGFKKNTAEGLSPEEEDELRRLKQELEVSKKILSKAQFPEGAGG